MTTPHRIYPNRNEVAQEYTHLVKQFVEAKYPREEYIKCLFDLYEVNPTDNSVTHMEKIYYPTKDGYIHLLVALLTYPDITFQDLPIYVPSEVYDHMLVGLRFPRYEHICNLSIHPRHRKPIAVEMTTLQQDAREIAGEDMYSFLLPPSHQQGAFQELAVYLECRRMEIKVTHVKEDALRFLTFSKIDAEKVQQLLNVSDFRGIETALNEMYDALSAEEQADLFWLIHWLDKNNLNYDYTKNEMK